MADPSEVSRRVAEELAACGVSLVASLPDNWITGVMDAIERNNQLTHVPVNREESAIGLCSGAYFGGIGAAALMGASGFMTSIYAITKINYTYEVPLLILITLRGTFGDHHKHHVSNGLYLEPVLDAIDLPYLIVDRPDELPRIGEAYRHSRTFSRPTVVALTRSLLKGGH
ncbi:MAG: thiamine pyrophosphate-binding protein [Azospirillaceae bacterium]